MISTRSKIPGALVLSLMAASAFIPSIGNAEDNGYRTRAICISLAPYVSTNGSQAERTTNNFNLNILGGYQGGLAGFELGTLFNIDRGAAAGLQLCGGANYVGLDANAVQIASVFNYSGSTNGGQLAIVNISGDIVGAQVGLVNIAHDVKGAQVGFFNLSNEVIGPTVGVLNISKRGQFHIDLWASETSLPGFGIKMGSQSFHSILSFAAQPLGDDIWWMPGGGMGGHFYYDLFFVDVDVMAYMVNGIKAMQDTLSQGMDGINLFKLQISPGWVFPPDFAIFAGPSLNVFMSNKSDGSGLALWDLPIYDNTVNGKNIRIWPGFTIGVQLR